MALVGKGMIDGIIVFVSADRSSAKVRLHVTGALGWKSRSLMHFNAGADRAFVKKNFQPF